MDPTQTTPEDAVNKLTALPPALVEEIAGNPDAIRPMVRGMAAINLYNLFSRVQNPNTGIKDRIELQSVLNKMGGMEAKSAETGSGGAGVIINITRAKDSSERLTIEGTAVAIPDAAQD